MSAQRQEVAFFGEGISSTARKQSIRFFDLDRGVVEERAILVGNLFQPLAATYRAQDDAYYVLDRSSTETVRLVRLPRGMNVEVLAEWPARGAFSKFALTTGRDGSIVLSSSSATEHAIAVLATNGRAIKLQSMRTGPDPLSVPAFKSLDGQLTYVRIDRDGTQIPDSQPVRMPARSDIPPDVRDVAMCF
jgi:hypothetical protein